MNKIMVSLVAASLVATSVMAIDVKTSGQAVVYYQTWDKSSDMFKQAGSMANFGVQANIDANLGNGYTLGTQLSHLSTSGLAYTVVGGTPQGAQVLGDSVDLMLTKINLAKKIANTTIKLGRQELPKSLSPLAFSEGWSVFKNTFDAALVINSDIPGTTLVLAAVDTSNGVGPIGGQRTFGTRGLLQTTNTATTANGAKMLTAQTTLVPLMTVTGSYYILGDLAATTGKGATALWADVKVADKSLPMGLKVGVQYGSITPEESTLKATTAMGAKVGVSVAGANICVAYSSVDDGTVGMTNTGTGVKTPLYTQLILNQGAIDHDNTTIAAKANYALGGTSKILAGFSTTSGDKSGAAGDNTYIELAYKVKVQGADLLAAYINTTTGTADAVNAVRVVARVAF